MGSAGGFDGSLRAGSIDSRAGVDVSRGRFNRFRSRIST